jgi:L-asparaginase II
MSFLAPSDGVVLAELTRDGITESLHHGVLSVVDRNGKILLERGNSAAVVYPRSTLKPLQAAAVLSTGVKLTPLEIALATASHSGSLEHRGAVTDFLHRHGFDDSDLKCPVDWPLGPRERAELAASGGVASRVAMNCSGKHASFLAASAHQSFDTADYLEPEHPLQSLIVRSIEEWTGEKISFSSTDGCGAPLHALSLRGLATGIARLSLGETEESAALLAAVQANAWAVDGIGRANTVTIETIGGIAKIGAEGLVVIATPEGVAVAVKIMDGSMRATTPAALEALLLVGAITAHQRDTINSVVAEPVTGGGRIIGGLKVQI